MIQKQERPKERENVETAAAPRPVVSPEAWEAFEALDNPWALDDEVVNAAWFEEDIDGAPKDVDEDAPCWILGRLLNP